MADSNKSQTLLDSRAVVLPCEPDHFRDFIAGLLGRPQTIERIIRGRFEVDRHNIENLYHLIDQRISSQNDATLIQFTARILFDDDSSVLLNSFFDFGAYNEVKPLVSQGVFLSWTYLVKFKNKAFPEKQQIEVGFFTGDAQRVHQGEDLIDRMLLGSFGERMLVRINHTDRSWGADIESLLEGFLRSLVRVDSNSREFVRRKSIWIGIISGIILFISIAVYGRTLTTELSSQLLGSYKFQVSSPVNLEQISNEMSIVLDAILKNPSSAAANYDIYLSVAALVVSVTSAILIGLFASKAIPSFVLLTTKAQEKRAQAYKKDKENWLKFLGSVFGAIAISVLGNYAFYLVLKNYIQ